MGKKSLNEWCNNNKSELTVGQRTYNPVFKILLGEGIEASATTKEYDWDASQIIIFIYDITNPESLKTSLKIAERKNVDNSKLIIFLGNKLDKKGEDYFNISKAYEVIENAQNNYEITKEEIFEISVESGENLEDLFERIVKKYEDRRIIEPSIKKEPHSQTEKPGGCCIIN